MISSRVMTFLYILLFCCLWLHETRGIQLIERDAMIPVVINTWKMTNATRKAWEVLSNEHASALDAVESGCRVCEEEQCDYTVGYGGSPDENGETTLDSMIMDGTTMNMGAVGQLRRVKNAIGVARKVLEYTEHSLLVGDSAKDFAVAMGFKEEDLSTPYSRKLHQDWKENNCQPNFWTKVSPDPLQNCGPYAPLPITRKPYKFGPDNHDTIGMLALDENLNIAAGTSSNGAKHKIPGRVGDSPIVGAGCYADSTIGGAAATGDGDVMMRFLPSFLAVEEMRRGSSPAQAAQTAMARIGSKFPSFTGGLVVLRKDGKFGAACFGLDTFPYSVRNQETGDVVVYNIDCLQP